MSYFGGTRHMKVKFLKAFNGDCILLSIPSGKGEKNILIDGGTRETYRSRKQKNKFGPLKKLIDEFRTKKDLIDLLILTHIDDDHIAGILEWFDHDPDAFRLIKEVWFNSGSLIAEKLNLLPNKDLDQQLKDSTTTTTNTSIKQGIEFSKYLKDKGILHEELIIQGEKRLRFGATFTFLSPDKVKLEKLLKEWEKKEPGLGTASAKNDYHLSLEEHIATDVFEEDTAYSNGSSIAFILTLNEINFLFLGDAHPSMITSSLTALGYTSKQPLQAALVKLSHHGSSANTSTELLELIDCDKFVISTNGSQHQHPHKQMLARLINVKKNSTILFNYPERMQQIFLPGDKDFAPFNIKPVEHELEF